MKKILFSPHPNFINIAKHFLDKDRYEIIGVQDDFIKALRDLDFENVVPLNGTPEISSEAYQLSVKTIKSRKRSKEILNKYNMSEVYSEFIDRIDTLIYGKIHGLITFLLTLDLVKPDIIILHNDIEPYMMALALWAKEHKVPCLHVPHSVIIDSSERSGIGTDIHDIVTSSHLAVGGSYQRKWYESRDVPSDKIFETGLPQFDKIIKTPYDKERAKRLLKIKHGRPVITYASSWRQDTNLLGCHDGVTETYKTFLEAIKEIKPYTIIKLHPNSGKQTIDWHMMVAKQMGVEAIISIQHLYTILQASDIIIAYGPSNILLESSFYPMHLATTHGYEDDAIVTKVGKDATKEMFLNSIRDMLSKPISSDPSGFRSKYLGIVDGNAHERIANLIKELLNG